MSGITNNNEEDTVFVLNKDTTSSYFENNDIFTDSELTKSGNNAQQSSEYDWSNNIFLNNNFTSTGEDRTFNLSPEEAGGASPKIGAHVMDRGAAGPLRSGMGELTVAMLGRMCVCCWRVAECVERAAVCVERATVCVERAAVCVERAGVCVERAAVCVERAAVTPSLPGFLVVLSFMETCVEAR